MRILFIGNSITKHGICSYWPGEWGMAASDKKKDKLQRKKLDFLKWRYNIELQKEFIKLRQELFPNSPIINPPKPQIERLADFDD